MCVGTCVYRCSVYAGMVLEYIMLGLSLSHAVKIYIPGLTTNHSRSINTILGSILNSKVKYTVSSPLPFLLCVWRLLSCEEVRHLFR